VSLVKSLGFIVKQGSGSRVRWVGKKHTIRLHRPHPEKELKAYQIEEIIDGLKKEGVL